MPFPKMPCRRALIVFAAVASPLLAQVTESPQTVAPGRLLVRMDGLRVSFDRVDAAGKTYSALGVASTTVRAGLTREVDFQVGFDLFLRETLEYRGTRDSDSGLGDLSFRTKWTFWRDEKAGAAAAVMPYVKLPTGTGGVGSEAAEGGVIVPWAMDAWGGVRAGAMFQWDVIRNDADNGYDARWYLSGFAQRELTSAFALYAESTLELSSTGFSNSAGTIGIGALWRLSRGLQLDYELQRGLNHRAAEWTHVWRVNWEW
jgi:hypothetical protein